MTDACIIEYAKRKSGEKIKYIYRAKIHSRRPRQDKKIQVTNNEFDRQGNKVEFFSVRQKRKKKCLQ